MLRDRITAILLAVLALLFFQNGAAALDSRQAGRVVETMEALREDFGDLFYDETAADHWYEEDEFGEGRIRTAGFTRDQWRTAMDATMAGFYASMDRAEVEALFATMTTFEQRTDFTPEQKEAMRQIVREARERMARYRSSGAVHVRVVTPFSARIKAVLGEGLGE